MNHKRTMRWIIIASMTREQHIRLIKRKDSSYAAVDFDTYSDGQVHLLASKIDRKAQEERFKKQGVRVCLT